MSVPEARQDSGLAESGPREEPVTRDAAEQRKYSRPRAFSVGPATELVRGDLIGKNTDAFTGYYTEV